MRKGDEKRQAILDVAEKLFYTKGYEATSVQDILDVLDTSKGSFYHHFESKEQVLGHPLCATRRQGGNAGKGSTGRRRDTFGQAAHGVLLCDAVAKRRGEVPLPTAALAG